MTLKEYMRWVVAQEWDVDGLPFLERRSGPLYVVDVVHREGNCQVERVTVESGAVPLHRHPGVDTYENYRRGTGVLQVNSHHYALGHDAVQVRVDGALRHLVPVPATAWHGSTVGPDGLMFLSIQRWADGIPLSSVLELWESPEYRRVVPAAVLV